MRLEGKVALITGGNSGIGLATAKLFVSEGAKVAITGRNEKTLQAARQELGPDVLVAKVDVTDMVEMSGVVSTIVERFGKLDVIFANAGTVATTPLGHTSAETFESIMKVNVTATFLLMQVCLSHLNERASIIFNGSIQSQIGRAGFSAYAASKGALRAMARVMASELSSLGIPVNVVTPGAVDTPIWDSVIPGADREHKKAFPSSIAKAIPLGRIGEPGEIANAVLFLASDESSFMQSSEIVVDGGTTGNSAGAPMFHTVTPNTLRVPLPKLP